MVVQESPAALDSPYGDTKRAALASMKQASKNLQSKKSTLKSQSTNSVIFESVAREPTAMSDP